MMLVAIDIGNTTTTFGVFDKKKLGARFAIATQPWRTPDEITLQLKALFKANRLHPRPASRDHRPPRLSLLAGRGGGLRKTGRIVICSVVPRMASVLMESLKSLQAIPILVVGQDIHVPLKNRYRYPEQVGQDRLVGAYAAWRTYRSDCIVADFGTAITIDVVTKAGEYLGGVIAPGLEISLEALAARTALLPKVELCEPPELLARDTANSIRSGVLHGCAALVDGLVARLKQKYVPNATVVATGGAGALIARHARSLQHVEPHLVLNGLYDLTTTMTKSYRKALISTPII